MKLIRNVLVIRIKAGYVPMNIWFTNGSFIVNILVEGLDVIRKLKDNIFGF